MLDDGTHILQLIANDGVLPVATEAQSIPETRLTVFSLRARDGLTVEIKE